MNFDPAPAAAALFAARRARATLSPLPPEIAPRDEAQGVAVQHALAGLMEALPPAGFKIGATARRMQDYLGLSGPAAGFMPEAGIQPSGATLAYADFRNPGAECEIAVRLGRDLPPGPCTSEQAQAAVSEVFAAIEIVENRYGAPPAGDLQRLGTPTLIADQVFHAAAVLGAPGAAHSLNLADLPGHILVDGVEQAHGVGADLLGDPMNALAWLAASPVAVAFGGLRAGQVVMLGSVTPPIWLSQPGTVTVAFTGLPEVRVTLA
jgi:2-keto-4-pentenoate hydratase